MQTSSIQLLEPAGGELQNRHLLNIVMVYEDFAAGKHAKETYDFLVHQLGRDFDFNNQMWKFDILGNSKMRQLAVKDAAGADLIIVSTHGKGELPPEARAWVNEWAADKGNVMALVALADQPKSLFDEDTAIRDCLEEAARRAQVAFFAQPDDWPEREEDFSKEQVAERAEKACLVITDFIHKNPAGDRWGINE